MDSNSQAGRAYSVANAVRKLRARAASISLGRTRAATVPANEDEPGELHYPQPHLSLVPEPAPESAETAPDGKPPKRRSRIKPALVLVLLMLLSIFAWWLVTETRTSSLQASFFSHLAKKISYKVEPGPSNSIRFPSDSPYDERLGYANMPD